MFGLNRNIRQLEIMSWLNLQRTSGLGFICNVMLLCNAPELNLFLKLLRGAKANC